MNNLKIQPAEVGNIFNIPTPYCNDVWDICEWDYYKNSSDREKKAWIRRSNIMNNKADFSICLKPVAKEEIKYFTYTLIEYKKISAATLGEYMDRYKLLFRYIQINEIKSVLDINIDDYEKYICNTNHKKDTQNGTFIVNCQKVNIKKKNRLISFIVSLQKSIIDFYESQKSIWERETWNGEEINPNEKKIYLHFSDISQEPMKKAIKLFLKLKLLTINVKSAKSYLYAFKDFCHWLEEYDSDIQSFKDINRDILESYFEYLRLESDYSQHKINIYILHLHVLFDYGILSDSENFPQVCLFTNNDYFFKTKHRSNFYEDEDIKIIYNQLIPALPKVYGRMILVLSLTGMRINELLKLTPSSLRKNPDGSCFIDAYMSKTKKVNNIPISENAFHLLESEVARNKKRFENVPYVFLRDNGTSFPYSVFVRQIKKAIVENNILGKNGELLDFRTHRFRATRATHLINLGINPDIAADMLGQSCLSSLSYYATATNQALQEQMQTYLKKQSILINNIGKIDNLVIEDYKNAIPLCNGWCCKPPELGVCEKINACLNCSQFKPSSQFLLNYKLQLSDVEAGLSIAVANNYTRMIEKYESQKENLEKIISELESRTYEQKT